MEIHELPQPLLSQTEVRKLLVSAGYDRKLADMVFGTLVRKSIRRAEERTPTDLAYLLDKRGGLESAAISIPNLRARLPAIKEHAMVDIGPKLAAVCGVLVEIVDRQTTADVDTPPEPQTTPDQELHSPGNNPAPLPDAPPV